jgi:hypothetical protein
MRYAIPLADSRGEIGQHFGESPYFALMELDLGQRNLRRQAMWPLVALDNHFGSWKLADRYLTEAEDVLPLFGRSGRNVYLRAGILGVPKK